MQKEPTKVPCREACPAGVDVPRYLRFIAAGKYADALATIREGIPFPAVCGYVCPGPCEIKCQLAQVADAPEAIRTLKRFVTEHAPGLQQQNGKISPTGKSVAIVGSGPAGLTAAYYLAKQGHRLTVFEALSEPGGMMRVGIPAYRLPRQVLDAEIADIIKAGIEVKTDSRIESLENLFTQGYDAAFLALGAQGSVRMGIEGEDSPGVIDALSFLRQVNLGQRPAVGRRVAVVGGGNAAVDVSRTALRLGAEAVTIVYRRTRAEMRAYREEINEALREGVEIIYLATPSRISRADGYLTVECLRTRPAGSGALIPPECIEGSEFTLEAETVIAAVGQEPVVPPGFTIKLKDKAIPVDYDGMATAKAKVFAGADCVTGARSVIEAIAAGKKAAVAIDRYLGGRGVIEERLAPPEAAVTPLETAYPPPTVVGSELPRLPVTERCKGFPVVELPLSPEAAAYEANRCLKCDLPIGVEATKCRSCFVCQLVCSLRFEGAFNTAKAFISLQPVFKAGGEAEMHITFDDKCDGCGLCVRYCPFGALSRGT